MLESLLGFLPTLLLAGAVIVAVVAVVIRMYKNRKQGKSSCACGCRTCGQCPNAEDTEMEREN